MMNDSIWFRQMPLYAFFTLHYDYLTHSMTAFTVASHSGYINQTKFIIIYDMTKWNTSPWRFHQTRSTWLYRAVL